ncbi:hypothetical protein [Delftia sp. ZNC0008]|uniref:hypothetical protein n=1 Tax=Delftia sp. ZNC0008 TaxID=1339242 RepID=UPI000647261C|nr:hypothetical protein [Delftia sp. ZNC0008]
MSNLYLQLREILAPGRVQIGKVAAVADGAVTVELPGAGLVRAKGQAAEGATVFVLEGVIQGPAPDLPVYIDVI